MASIRTSKFCLGDRVRIVEKYRNTFNSITDEGTVKLIRPYGERNLYLVEFDNKKFQKEFLSYQLELAPSKSPHKKVPTPNDVVNFLDDESIEKQSQSKNSFDTESKKINNSPDKISNRFDTNTEIKSKEQIVSTKTKEKNYAKIEDVEEPKFNVGQTVIFTPSALLLLKEKSNINVNEMYREFVVTAHNLVNSEYVYNLRETNLHVSENDIVLAETDKVKLHLQILDLMSNYHKLKTKQQKL